MGEAAMGDQSTELPTQVDLPSYLIVKDDDRWLVVSSTAEPTVLLRVVTRVEALRYVIDVHQRQLALLSAAEEEADLEEQWDATSRENEDRLPQREEDQEG